MVIIVIIIIMIIIIIIIMIIIIIAIIIKIRILIKVIYIFVQPLFSPIQYLTLKVEFVAQGVPLTIQYIKYLFRKSNF